jgi:acid phosphatase type 7
LGETPCPSPLFLCTTRLTPHPPHSNHEEGDSANFIYAISSTYRFKGMPTGGRNDAGTGLRYYSWEAGPVHYISLDSFYDLYGPLQPITKWIVADLASVDHSRTPWIVVSLHAPWYNSNKDHQLEGEPARLGLEQIFITAGVSAIFSGHVHAYERSACVDGYKVVPCGPGSMTHFNVGDAGAGLYTTWNAPQPAWSVFRNASWGHGRWTVLNRTHSEWSWHMNDSPATESEDAVVLLNSNPKAY